MTTERWKTHLDEQYRDAPIEELLDEVLSRAFGELYARQAWNEYQYLVGMLKERLSKLSNLN